MHKRVSLRVFGLRLRGVLCDTSSACPCSKELASKTSSGGRFCKQFLMTPRDLVSRASKHGMTLRRFMAAPRKSATCHSKKREQKEEACV